MAETEAVNSHAHLRRAHRCNTAFNIQQVLFSYNTKSVLRYFKYVQHIHYEMDHPGCVNSIQLHTPHLWLCLSMHGQVK